jgi:hypothetical protein
MASNRQSSNELPAICSAFFVVADLNQTGCLDAKHRLWFCVLCIGDTLRPPLIRRQFRRFAIGIQMGFSRSFLL